MGAQQPSRFSIAGGQTRAYSYLSDLMARECGASRCALHNVVNQRLPPSAVGSAEPEPIGAQAWQLLDAVAASGNFELSKRMQLHGARSCRFATDVTLTSEAPLLSLPGPSLIAAAFSARHHTIYYVSEGFSSVLWYNVSTGHYGEQPVGGLPAGAAAASLAASRDGSMLAASFQGSDSSAKVVVFAITAGGGLREAARCATGAPGSALCFLPGNASLAFCGSASGALGVTLWDLRTGATRTLAPGRSFHSLAACVGAAGPCLAAATAAAVNVWDAVTGKIATEFKLPSVGVPRSIRALVTTPDGWQLAIATRSDGGAAHSDAAVNETLLYDTHSWALAAAQPAPAAAASALAVAADGRRMAAGAAAGSNDAGCVQVHCLDSGHLQAWFKAHEGGDVLCVGWLAAAPSAASQPGSADSLLTVGADGWARVWRLDSWTAWDCAAAAAAEADSALVSRLCRSGLHNATRDAAGRTMLHVACEKGEL